jgi:spermidine/putrescine transport system ATP-binding protein
VYDAPSNRFVADFMGLVNLVRAELVRTDGEGRAVVRLLSDPRLEVRVSVDGAARIGETVSVAIRPEHVALSTGGVAARIEQATFLGSLNDYVVSVAGIGPAAPLSLRCQASAQLVLPEGAATSVTICPDRPVLVSAD